LDEFTADHRGLQLEVRIKAVDGVGGLLESLEVTSKAAPSALPDVIALPWEALETAALGGLIRPLDEFAATFQSEDWFEYARKLSRVDGSVYGFPFAGDALLLAYRPEVVDEPPASWDDLLSFPGVLAFPAADPQSLVTLALYLSAGGQIEKTDQDQLSLDQARLAEVLAFYQQARAADRMPYWLAQYEQDASSWQAYRERRAQLVFTWFTRFLGSETANATAMPLIAPDGLYYTLAKGWVWAIPALAEENADLSQELISFLSQEEFLADWSEAAGFLPTRSSVLASWSQSGLQTMVSQLVLVADVEPPASVLNVISPVLQQATIEVIKGISDPEIAARNAIEQLSGP
jgi:ABC-type glycerol-3-phosphate transport system substrate-binding protein